MLANKVLVQDIYIVRYNIMIFLPKKHKFVCQQCSESYKDYVSSYHSLDPNRTTLMYLF